MTANTLDVQAFDTNAAAPKTKVVAAGAIAINKATSDITLTRATEAQIKSGSNLTMSSGNLVVRAESNSLSSGAMSSTGVGAITLDFLEVTSSIDSTTRAEIASGATVSVPGGNLDVVAVTTNRANARTSSFSIGAVTFGKSNPTAEITATTEALALGTITGPGGTPGAINVRVTADGYDATTAGAESFAIGLVSIGFSTVIADTAPTVTARGGGTIRAGGDVVIESTSVGDADAASRTTSGGAVAVTKLDATAKAVTNVTTEILPHTIIEAGGDITISARHGELPTPTAEGTFNAADDVSLPTDTIDLGLEHGLLTGDTVTYDSKGGTVIGGLGNGRTYGVIKTSDSELQLGTTFQSAAVDTTRDVLTFTAPHNLQDGDRVIYQSDGPSGVGNLESGKTYQVVVIDSTTIKLKDPEVTLADAKEFSGSDITGDTITLDGHGFVDGQAVTYREPGAVEFGLPGVDVVGGTYNAEDPAANTAPADNNNIYLGPNHGLLAGDEVIYTAGSGAPIPELTSGDRYFVIFDPAKPDEIQLARTLAEAMGDPGDPDATPEPVPATLPNPIALSRSTDPVDESTQLSLRTVTDQAIGGLTDGVTYYVTQVDGDTFKLATDEARSHIVALGRVDPVSGTTVLTGTSTLGTEGVDLTNGGSGAHRLVLDLTSAGSGTQLLDGVGGARALAGAPSGDGVVTASASGSGGGIVRSSDAKTTASSTPTVTTIIGDGASLDGNDITVDAAAFGNASASSANSGGGLVSIGDAESHLTISSTGRVAIGAATFSAAHDISVSSYAAVNGSVLASSDGGGLVDFADADLTADIIYASIVDIGTDADLRAENLVTVDSVSATNVKARAVGDSAGLGSSADTTAFLTIGDNDTLRAVTKTVLGARARLQAGNAVIVRSRVAGMAASAAAEAESGGAVADADAAARIDIYDAVKVDLAADAAITAETVTITAEHAGVNVSSRSDADTDGLYANADSEARAHYDSLNDVFAAAGATVAAGDLGVASSQHVTQFFRRATADVDVFGDETRSTPGAFLPGRSITWNGDLTFLADPTPELEIAASGDIVIAEGVTVNNGQSTGTVVAAISVDPIVNFDGGSATFTVNDDVIASGPSIPDGEIRGSGGTISSGSTFPRVDITNRSDNDLVIHDINLANGTVLPDVTFRAKSVSLEFEVGNVAPAGDLDILILNEGTGDVRIDGLVENPVGLIRIENRGGAIVSNDGTDDILRGQMIELISAGGIGSAALRLNADLVTSERRATDFDARAADDIWLNLTGRVRDIDVSNSHFNAGRVETTGGDVDILFQSSLQETASIGFATGVTVTVNAADPLVYLEHFSPDPDTVSPAPLDFRLFTDTGQAVAADARYSFEQITGTNIHLHAANSDVGGPRIDVTAHTDHGDSGQIDALFNGSIDLTETVGDMRIGTVESTEGDAALRAADEAANIYDVTTTGDNGMTPSVIGKDVTLIANGAIGTVTDFLEIDSSRIAAGEVTVSAGTSVFLTETSGDLNLDGALAKDGDVSITVRSGSIFDVEPDNDPIAADFMRADIQASRIDLQVSGGGIGTPTNDLEFHGGGVDQLIDPGLEIDPYHRPAAGRLWVEADESIYLMEVSGAVIILAAASAGGDVRIGVRDTTEPTEAFNLPGAGGQTLVGTTVPIGRIDAAGSVTINAGDDVNIESGAVITAGSSVEVNGDSTDPDPDIFGSTIDITGDIVAQTLTISGGDNFDFIQLRRPGQIAARVSTTINGNSGDDRFFIQYVDGPMTINGGDGSDRYFISGNAAKSLFVITNAYSDDGDVFSRLGGELTDINATLTIHTGKGSAAGTVPDALYVSTAGSQAPRVGMLDGGSITGLGMAGSIDFATPTTGSDGVDVLIGLGAGEDQFEVTSAASDVVVYVQGRGGNDTLDVGKSGRTLAGISGIVAFLGEDGTDTLNVYGDAPRGIDPVAGGQLTAISITGMGMGTNDRFTTHNDRFGAALSVKDPPVYPAAIYYANRDTTDGSIHSTVEMVNVFLGGGDDDFIVDSTCDYGLTQVSGGGGSDTLRVGSTGAGLNPTFPGRVDYIDGPLMLAGDADTDLIIVDDSGDLGTHIGTFLGDTVTGLDINGSIAFDAGDDVEIRLGGGADRFYIPVVNADQSVRVRAGDGFDKIYVGTTPGNESQGSLDAIAGVVRIDGDGPEAGDSLFVNDQSTTSNEIFRVTNQQLPTEPGLDLTTVTRTGAGGEIRYTTIETVVLNAGGGNDIVDLEATHREQSTVAGIASTFTINAGGGDDTVTIGEQTAGGFSLERFAIDADPATPTTRGIRVLVNGQAGNDTVHFQDTAPTDPLSLAFVEKLFADLFPADPPTVPPTSSPESVQLFSEIFGDDPQSTSYSQVIISSAGEVNVQEDAGAAKSTFTVSTDATGGTFDLRITGAPGGQVDVRGIPFDAAATGAGGLEELIEATGLVDVSVTQAAEGNEWRIEFVGPSSGIAVEADGLKLRQSPPLNISSRLIEGVVVSLGSGADVVQLVSGSYQSDITVNSGDGNDTFVIENGVDATGHQIVFNGEGDDDTVFVDFEKGVPDGTVSLTFNGGPNTLGTGDKLRIAGDGVAGGGTYRPSATSQRSGTIELAGNHFEFTNVEPLVVHGLPDFAIIHSDEAAVLDLDSVAVADLELKNLVLHVVTVDGVVSWTPPIVGDKLNIVDVQALEPKHIGGAIASSGNTLIIGAELDGASCGAVLVYEWINNEWHQVAKLLPQDRIGGGQGFGKSVAIDESATRLIIGAPDDDSRGTEAGAVYIFEKVDGYWTQKTKLFAPTPAPDSGTTLEHARFGESVGISGNVAVVGAPGDDADNMNAAHDSAYIFERSATGAWIAKGAPLSVPNDSLDDFGRSVAISGNRLVVGAPGGLVLDIRSGFATVYARGASGWSLDENVTPSEPTAGEHFGSSVSIAMDGGISRIVVGAPNWNGKDGTAVTKVVPSSSTRSAVTGSVSLA